MMKKWFFILSRVGFVLSLAIIFDKKECFVAKNREINRNTSSDIQSISSEKTCFPLFNSLFETNRRFDPDHEKLDKWLSDDLLKMKQLVENKDSIPESLRKVSRVEKARNDLFFSLVKNINGIIVRKSKNDFLNALAIIINYIEKSPFHFLVKGSTFNRIKRLLDHPSILNEQGERTLIKFSDFQKQFDRDLIDDISKYGADFFDRTTIAQGRVNSFSIKLFAFLNGDGPLYDRLSVNSISLLHPIVDQAMDKGLMGKKTFEKLGQYLSHGIKPEIESDYEKLLFGYLYRFEKAFPRDKVPGFWFSLKRLFDSQVKSLKQISSEYDPDFYYRLSLDKGGLSTVLAAYTSLGPLTENQYAFFYRAGGIFQIIDDLLDISKDLDDGVKTVWTHAIQNNLSFGPSLAHLLALEKGFEMHFVDLARDFDNPQTFISVYTFSFKLSILKALARQKHHVDREVKELIRGRLSLSLSNLNQLMSGNVLRTRPMTSPDPNLQFIHRLLEDVEDY